MSNPRIPFQRPEMPPSSAIDRYFESSRAANYYSNGGPCAIELQARVESRIGGGHAVLVNNATSGLMVAACAAFRRNGTSGHVIVPSFTFAATATALIWAGYEPVFCDVDPVGLHLDPSALAALLYQYRDSIVGVLACSTFGVAPPAGVVVTWESLTRQSRVPLIVDSAAGFGSLDELGRGLGHQGTAEVFSFHATKPFAVGEGGAITTDDEELAAEMRSLINFGFNAERVVSGPAGMNAKMPEIMCAIGLAVDDCFDSVITHRRSIATLMVDRLAPMGVGVQPNLLTGAIQFLPVTVPPASRSAVFDTLLARGVEARRYFDPALHCMPAFRRYDRGPLPVTEALMESVISLPMSNNLTSELANDIVDAVRDGLGAHRCRSGDLASVR